VRSTAPAVTPRAAVAQQQVRIENGALPMPGNLPWENRKEANSSPRQRADRLTFYTRATQGVGASPFTAGCLVSPDEIAKL